MKIMFAVGAIPMFFRQVCDNTQQWLLLASTCHNALNGNKSKDAMRLPVSPVDSPHDTVNVAHGTCVIEGMCKCMMKITNAAESNDGLRLLNMHACRHIHLPKGCLVGFLGGCKPTPVHTVVDGGVHPAVDFINGRPEIFRV